MMEKQKLTREQIEFLHFIRGSGPLRGKYWFGDKPEEERGDFWWRRDLGVAFKNLPERKP